MQKSIEHFMIQYFKMIIYTTCEIKNKTYKYFKIKLVVYLGFKATLDVFVVKI